MESNKNGEKGKMNKEINKFNENKTAILFLDCKTNQ